MNSSWAIMPVWSRMDVLQDGHLRLWIKLPRKSHDSRGHLWICQMKHFKTRLPFL